MPAGRISYKESGYFSPLVTDYLAQDEKLRPLYCRFPTIENFRAQIGEKQRNYEYGNRTILVSALREQYTGFNISEVTQRHIASLSNENTFTITTGHQLNLFTGPLYFLYKIVSAINLAKQLKSAYPEFDFVPVYWMATEDHDFAEIDHFTFRGKKFKWSRESKGAVGRLSTDGLQEVADLFGMELGAGENSEQLRKLFSDAYLGHDTLSDATRFLANALFGDHGLVILDGDDAHLKRLFAPYIKRELLEQAAFREVSATLPALAGYDVQVNPREINLFYLDEDLRERIVVENGLYRVNNTSIEFTEAAILAELETHPEKFSPNVIMRPLYEEVVLPNLCYIGGGGEIAYWLELKSFFKAMDITFPMLLLRNSALVVTQKQSEKAAKLGLSWADLFLKREALLEKKTREISDIPIDFTPQREALKKQFDYLEALADKTDRSFTGAVKAQEAKQMKGLDNLEKRLLIAQKRKYWELLSRISALQDELFPGGLQERTSNFAEFHQQNGTEFIESILANLNPLSENFSIITL